MEFKELVEFIDITSNVAILILIWRSKVADKERRELLNQLSELGHWVQQLVMELLKKTDIR